MHDGDLVVTAIVRQAETIPALKAAIIRMFSYTGDWQDHGWVQTAAKYQHVKDHDLSRVAAKVRKKARDDFAEWMARQDAYRSEMTAAGEQTVIPGCEADDPRTGGKQMDLF